VGSAHGIDRSRSNERPRSGQVPGAAGISNCRSTFRKGGNLQKVSRARPPLPLSLTWLSAKTPVLFRFPPLFPDPTFVMSDGAFPPAPSCTPPSRAIPIPKSRERRNHKSTRLVLFLKEPAPGTEKKKNEAGPATRYAIQFANPERPVSHTLAALTGDSRHPNQTLCKTMGRGSRFTMIQG
jgi:hypothetical protein